MFHFGSYTKILVPNRITLWKFFETENIFYVWDYGTDAVNSEQHIMP